jgi:site-specific recombinase XerD
MLVKAIGVFPVFKIFWRTIITIDNVSFKDRTISTLEKGGSTHTYSITQQGLQAIRDYLDAERGLDAEAYRTQALFLPANSTQNRTGQLHPNAINDIWNAVCAEAKVEGKTPHSARHRMGRHIMDKTHNVEAVQRQLGHKNAAYSLAYSRITREELSAAIEDN